MHFLNLELRACAVSSGARIHGDVPGNKGFHGRIEFRKIYGHRSEHKIRRGCLVPGEAHGAFPGDPAVVQKPQLSAADFEFTGTPVKRAILGDLTNTMLERFGNDQASDDFTVRDWTRELTATAKRLVPEVAPPRLILQKGGAAQEDKVDA